MAHIFLTISVLWLMGFTSFSSKTWKLKYKNYISIQITLTLVNLFAPS